MFYQLSLRFQIGRYVHNIFYNLNIDNAVDVVADQSTALLHGAGLNIYGL